MWNSCFHLKRQRKRDVSGGLHHAPLIPEGKLRGTLKPFPRCADCKFSGGCPVFPPMTAVPDPSRLRPRLRWTGWEWMPASFLSFPSTLHVVKKYGKRHSLSPGLPNFPPGRVGVAVVLAVGGVLRGGVPRYSPFHRHLPYLRSLVFLFNLVSPWQILGPYNYQIQLNRSPIGPQSIFYLEFLTLIQLLAQSPKRFQRPKISPRASWRAFPNTWKSPVVTLDKAFS